MKTFRLKHFHLSLRALTEHITRLSMEIQLLSESAALSEMSTMNNG